MTRKKYKSKMKAKPSLSWKEEVLGTAKKEKKEYSTTISQEIIDEVNRCAHQNRKIDFDTIIVKE